MNNLHGMYYRKGINIVQASVPCARGGKYKPITYPLSIFQAGMGINGYIHKGKGYFARQLYFFIVSRIVHKSLN
jgi:hypothetical protein